MQEIAQNALKAYSQIPGIGSETPSVQSIIDAYQRDGHGDSGLLMAILEAKKIEDEVSTHFLDTFACAILPAVLLIHGIITLVGFR